MYLIDTAVLPQIKIHVYMIHVCCSQILHFCILINTTTNLVHSLRFLMNSTIMPHLIHIMLYIHVYWGIYVCIQSALLWRSCKGIMSMEILCYVLCYVLKFYNMNA